MSQDQFDKLAQDLVAAYNRADTGALQRIAKHYRLQAPQGGLWSATADQLRAGIRERLRRTRLTKLSLADARRVVANEEGFETWKPLTRFLAELEHPDGPVARFEAAVETIITGDAATLERLLRDHPELIRSRSSPEHGATLLHYVSANGVESYRQQTPQNAVIIAQLLIAHGAEVDADLASGKRDRKRAGSTTLGLIATSVHPAVAGVQIALLEALLEAGANVDAPWGKSVVRAALANGRGEAARFLAGRGAHLDLESAAGVGQLDAVKQFVTTDGKLAHGATRQQLLSGFCWACEYGRTNVVEDLLRHAVAADARAGKNGPTGLHWAGYGGHLETVKLLLDHRAPVEAREGNFGGTPLDWTVYGWAENPPEAERDHYPDVAGLLVAAGARPDTTWMTDPNRELPIIDKIRSDPRMRAALQWPA
jgi:ankyrin repeat protein